MNNYKNSNGMNTENHKKFLEHNDSDLLEKAQSESKEKGEKCIPYSISFGPKFFYDNFGVKYDFEHYNDPEYMSEADMISQKGLYDMYGHLGFGNKNPKKRSAVKGHGITTIAQLFGCKVMFGIDEEPYALPLDLSDEEIMVLKPITDFENTEPMKTHIRQANEMFEKYGSSGISVNMQGYLSTAIKLRGEQLFFDFYENPEIAKRTMQIAFETTENLRTFTDKFNADMKYDGKEKKVQATNCAVALISPEIYEEFVWPLDNEISEKYAPNWGIHHCGNNMDRFAELYAKMPRGNYYDIGYGSDVKKCVDLYKDKAIVQNIRGRLSPSVLLLESPEFIESKVKYFIDSGVSNCVVVGADSKSPKENVEAFVHAVWKYGKLD